jgi:ethanolamine ammonia-lyase small subunit
MCKQIKIAVADGLEAGIEQRVEKALTALFAKIGEACLKLKTLAEIESQI